MIGRLLNFILFVTFAGATITLADTNTGDEYAPVADLLKSCQVCHGDQGASTEQQYPILAGQEFYYLYVQLKDFKSGLRANPIMDPVVSALDKDQMQLIAKYFSEQVWPDTEYASDDQVTRSAITVITAGQCIACHLGKFDGDSRVPRLAGQHPEYLAKTMLDFKFKSRQNSPAKGSLLASFADQELINVAQYLSSL